jgi:hypothetical protein
MGLWESVPMTRAIRPLIREARLFYIEWALREIPPLHPDVPSLVLERHELIAERNEQ